MSRREPDLIEARLGAGALAGVLLLMAISAALLFGMFKLFQAKAETPRATPVETAAIQTPGPRLEVDPREDRTRLERVTSARLEGCGWSDRSRGLARIPIERAMALTAQRGWPDEAAP